MSVPESVARFCATEASEADVEFLFDLLNQRARTLRQVKAAGVQVGVVVRTTSIKPKYLSGLVGEVVANHGDRVDLLLDPRSTQELRFIGPNRYSNPAPGVERHVFRGVPRTAVEVLGRMSDVTVTAEQVGPREITGSL